jgi:glycosyltransferase involved in cell wall biosynthesis
LGSYYSIITCRDSEDDIEKSIVSIYNQSIKPEYIIVIDDGSKDNTSKILNQLKYSIPNLHVITNPDLGYDITRVPFNYNKALRYIRDNNLVDTDYHMIASDDCTYEKDYANKIISYMDKNQDKVFVSGNYEKSKYNVPRGSGRFVRSAYFNKFHTFYPERMGYETVILYEAEMVGFNYAVLDYAKYSHNRALGTNHGFSETGPIMKILGYHPLFAFNRFLVYFVTGKPIGRRGAIRMLYDFVFYRPHRNTFDMVYRKELRDHIRKKQFKRLRRIQSRILSKLAGNSFYNQLTPSMAKRNDG